MKKANGQGSISYVKTGNRRNRWCLKISKDSVYDEKTGTYKRKQVVIGYYPTKSEAEKARIAYFAKNDISKIDLDNYNITFEELYNEYINSIEEELSDGYIRTLKSSFNYTHKIHKMKIRNINADMLEEVMSSADWTPLEGRKKGITTKASANMQTKIKSLFNLMFKYAMKKQYINYNPALAFNISDKLLDKVEEEKRVKNTFSYQEIKTMWKYVDSVDFTDMVLIGIYTGFRPQELAILEITKYLKIDVLLGGLKTKNGKNRFVPIHDDIKPLIDKRVREAKLLGSDRLFNDIRGQQGLHMTYDKYRRRFENVIKTLQLNFVHHSPGDTRRTFETYATRCGIPDSYVDTIMGHAQRGVGKAVYNKSIIADLKREMKKFDIFKVANDGSIDSLPLDFEKHRNKYTMSPMMELNDTFEIEQEQNEETIHISADEIEAILKENESNTIVDKEKEEELIFIKEMYAKGNISLDEYYILLKKYYNK